MRRNRICCIAIAALAVFAFAPYAEAGSAWSPLGKSMRAGRNGNISRLGQGGAALSRLSRNRGSGLSSLARGVSRAKGGSIRQGLSRGGVRSGSASRVIEGIARTSRGGFRRGLPSSREGMSSFSGVAGALQQLNRGGVSSNASLRGELAGLAEAWEQSSRRGGRYCPSGVGALQSGAGYGNPLENIGLLGNYLSQAYGVPSNAYGSGYYRDEADAMAKAYRDVGIANALVSLVGVMASVSHNQSCAMSPAPPTVVESYSEWVPEVFDPTTGQKLGGGYYVMRPRPTPVTVRY